MLGREPMLVIMEEEENGLACLLLAHPASVLVGGTGPLEQLVEELDEAELDCSHELLDSDCTISWPPYPRGVVGLTMPLL